VHPARPERGASTSAGVLLVSNSIPELP